LYQENIGNLVGEGANLPEANSTTFEFTSTSYKYIIQSPQMPARSVINKKVPKVTYCRINENSTNQVTLLAI
jgi:hypothetical protein